MSSLACRAAKLVEGLNKLQGVSCNAAEGALYAFPRYTVICPSSGERRERGRGEGGGIASLQSLHRERVISVCAAFVWVWQDVQCCPHKPAAEPVIYRQQQQQQHTHSSCPLCLCLCACVLHAGSPFRLPPMKQLQPRASPQTGCTAVNCWRRRASWWCQVGTRLGQHVEIWQDSVGEHTLNCTFLDNIGPIDIASSITDQRLGNLVGGLLDRPACVCC